MGLEDEIIQYLKSTSKESTQEVVDFLLKLWCSSSLKSPSKYDVILKYFAKYLMLKIQVEDSEWMDIQRLLKLQHPSNCVSSATKQKLLQSIIKALNVNQTFKSTSICLELASHESLKDFFTTHLDVYCEFMCAIMQDDSKSDDIFNAITTELYCFAKINEFKKLFLAHLIVPLSKVADNLTSTSKQAMWILIKSIYFSQLSMLDTNLEIFTQQLTANQRKVLMETFIFINKAKQHEVVNFLKFHYDNELLDPEDDAIFLSRTKQIFLLLSQHEIEMAPIKRTDAELFEQLSIRINSAIESARQSMDFSELMETLSSFIKCDAFLFEKSIYTILGDCMLQDKTSSELLSYESFFKIVVKIYGKDTNQFVKKLLKSIDDKLENFTIPKKRKRKLQGGSEVSRKKQKLSTSEVPSDSICEESFIQHIWPNALAEQFAEIVAGLNVTQTVKLWQQLNEFLAKVLKQVKDSSDFDENILFKIDFATSLLSELFVNTRLQEQLMNKSDKVALKAKDFDDTQSLFNDIILNIEYNDRVMSAFLKLSSSYESFLMLYFYHYNPEDNNDLAIIFIKNALKANSEWSIIQQRIKNFGKIDEKNHLNALLIQQRQKDQLFERSELIKAEELPLTLNDDKHIEFLLLQPDTRAFFVNSLMGKELKTFVQYFVTMEDKRLQSSVLCSIAKNQKLLDEFVADLMEGEESDLKTMIEILIQLPLACTSGENKKLVFGKMLKTSDWRDLLELITIASRKLFENDSYRTFFKDYTMKRIVEKFDDVEKCSGIYQSIISNSSRKVSAHTLENFNWILTSGLPQLLDILAKTVSEVQMTHVGGLAAEALNKFKIDLIGSILESFQSKNSPEIECEAFMVLLRLCSESMAKIEDDTKTQFMVLLQKYIKDIIKLPVAERVKLLLMTLRDAKKFNLNDEMKGTIVDALLTILKVTLRERMLADSDSYREVDLEKQLFSVLKPFKSNYQIACVGILRQILIELRDCGGKKFLYGFKIYQALFDIKAEDKSLNAIVKNYLKFYDDFVPKVLALDCADNIAALSQIVETNNALMKDSKFNLENSTLDDFMALLTDPLIKPPVDNIEEFCRFYSAVGESLFVIANIRQNYFKSRISQYFNVYRSFMDAIYFYKNDQSGELTPMEISLLLKLTLQLENIMKMISKNHITSIKMVSLYIASSIVSIFVRSPKVLLVGNKFKLNIRNVCYQLLSTFDDKTRKHVYSVADETSREVYDGLFMEIRRRA